MQIFGNEQGLKPAQRAALIRLYDRKVPPSTLISPSLAQTLCEISHELKRQIGLTLDRRGRVHHVIIGDAEQLFIPDLGRARAGRSRFRGIRLIHTHLRNEPLSEDDLTDLIRLRLDLIAAVGIREGRVGNLYHTHVLPDELTAEPTVTTPLGEKMDFLAFINALEAEFSRRTIGAVETEGQVRALAVHVSVDKRLNPQTSLRELSELANTAGVVVVDAIVQNRRAYDPKYVMGSGKLRDLLAMTMQLDCELVIFDQDLSPHQVRAIADFTDVNVIDRSQLILDIFARRAHTKEGKLAVELAQLKYRLPRLAQRSTAFSRLMGGVGGRGPGETQLEIDRRRARERITALERTLKQTESQRDNQRGRRGRRGVPVVALVGYTNAGKSTLFNAITHSDVLTEDKLFATLHVTSRRLRFPQARELVIIDTVGFIRDLPKDLISAFQATLEELREADILLHVVDVSDPRMNEQMASVEQILAEMALQDRPRMLVFNKADLLEEEILNNLCQMHQAFHTVARDRRTTRPLMEAIEGRLWQQDQAQLYV
ncbi:GTPase HflX [Myxococcota bacterium]|nr:GTPase HflX [Myxococcota bacterium]MBU1431668.1 GTPase HflX [Myxococcota bacterium]MBU1899257.1 GTPase HflX [Myxococcota bacterium]